MNLIKEYWITYFMGTNRDKFFDNNVFLQHGANLDAYVDGDKINIRRRGARNIGVTKNYDFVNPLPIKKPNNVSDGIPMANYSTDQLMIPSDWLITQGEIIKYEYFEEARMELMNEMVAEGIWTIGVTDATNVKNPLVDVASTNPVNAVDSMRVLKREDLVTMKTAFFKQYPGLRYTADLWIMVDSDQYGYWEANDEDFKKQIQLQESMGRIGSGGVGSLKNTPIFSMAGFNILIDDRTPIYTSGRVKKAYGSALDAGAGDLKGCPMFASGKSFGRALGSVQIHGHAGTSAGYQAEHRSFSARGYVGAMTEDKAKVEHMGTILRTRTA